MILRACALPAHQDHKGPKITDTRTRYVQWDYFRTQRRALRISIERLAWDLRRRGVELSTHQISSQDHSPRMFIRYCEQDPQFLPSMVALLGTPPEPTTETTSTHGGD